jgi:prophage regulatory protein
MRTGPLTTAKQKAAPALRVLRRAEVRHKTGLSVPTIYRLMDEGLFPRPVRLGLLAVGWPEHEIDAWLRDKIAARDAGEAA